MLTRNLVRYEQKRWAAIYSRVYTRARRSCVTAILEFADAVHCIVSDKNRYIDTLIYIETPNALT